MQQNFREATKFLRSNGEKGNIAVEDLSSQTFDVGYIQPASNQLKHMQELFVF